jgi:predicted rRNA methylase YqxC with S4 and FtsJ domains
MAKPKAPFVVLARLVAAQEPAVEDPEEFICSGLVRVDGAILTNPAARVRRDAAVQVTQLEAVRIAEDADLVALVKPMYELGLATLPTDPDQLDAAVSHAWDGVQRMPWQATGVIDSPVRGGRGAVEFLLHARRGRPSIVR